MPRRNLPAGTIGGVATTRAQIDANAIRRERLHELFTQARRRSEAPMRLTRSVSYAVGILLQVADESADYPVTAARIAKGCRFPPRFLYRILRRLVDAELLGGTSGPGGGYRLSRAPKAVTLLDIVAAVDSPPEPSVLTPVRLSHRAAIGKVNDICAAAAKKFTADLRRVKLSDLQTAKKSKRGKTAVSTRAAAKKTKKGSRRTARD
jgi:Rrf2 family protein